MANFHVMSGAENEPVDPVINVLSLADLRIVLSKGLEDFLAMPSHVAFISLIYPIIGACLAGLSFTENAFALLYPMMSGFALVGPLAAIGLYEISKQREMGLDPTWKDALNVLRSPAMPSILALGAILTLIFLIWLGTARALYASLMPPVEATSYTQFLSDVWSTPNGRQLFVIGNIVGLVFAVIALSISVVSFPMMLDRDVGLVMAVRTSVRAVLANPIVMAAWGVIVAALLAIGSIPFFVGLAVVMPVLGHATWHLYRRVVRS